MGTYKYVARDFKGSRKEGVKQAAGANDVLNWLREQGFTPVSVDALHQSVKRQQKAAGRSKKIRSGDLAALCWQLTTMVEGGIPITSALETISDDANPSIVS